MRIAIVHDQAGEAAPDTLDTFAEVEFVQQVLTRLGHTLKTIPVGPDAGAVLALTSALNQWQPDRVFNIIEGSGADPRSQASAAACLDLDGWRYTGSSFAAIAATTDKVITKAMLQASGIPTAAWSVFTAGGHTGPVPPIPGPWIVKPAWQDASVGITDAAVIHDSEALAKFIQQHPCSDQPLLVETYVDGREFNVSIRQRNDRSVEILPPAEIVFTAWPADKPKIVSYAAKWEPETFEYCHTVRRFVEDVALRRELEQIARACWDLFGLNGYGRVDLRQNAAGQLQVIEVNANPGIAPDSGFMAAALQAGYLAPEVFQAILENAIGSSAHQPGSGA